MFCKIFYLDVKKIHSIELGEGVRSNLNKHCYSVGKSQNIGGGTIEFCPLLVLRYSSFGKLIFAAFYTWGREQKVARDLAPTAKF